MKLTKEHQKEFEDWFYREFLDNYVSSNEPVHMKVALLSCYKKFVVEPQQTMFVSEKQHEDGVVKMIVNFLQRMKSHHDMIVRTDDNDKLIIVNKLTGSWYHLYELQDDDLI